MLEAMCSIVQSISICFVRPNAGMYLELRKVQR